MDLIGIIIFIVVIKKVIEKGKEEQEKMRKNASTQNVWDQVATQVKKGQTQSRNYTYASSSSKTSTQSDQWQKLARENIQKARQVATTKLREVEQMLEIEDQPAGTYQMPKHNVRTTPAREQISLQLTADQNQQENKKAMQQVQAGRVEARTTSILQRVVKNVDEDKEDVTLHTMEAEHNHSERVAKAEHHHDDMISENMLASIEDLMIKGYEADLCFERDFIGEAMDMISRFAVPSDVPDFSKEDVA